MEPDALRRTSNAAAYAEHRKDRCYRATRLGALKYAEHRYVASTRRISPSTFYAEHRICSATSIPNGPHKGLGSRNVATIRIFRGLSPISGTHEPNLHFDRAALHGASNSIQMIAGLIARFLMTHMPFTWLFRLSTAPNCFPRCS